MRKTAIAGVLAAVLLLPGGSVCTGLDYRRRQGCLRCRAPRRDRGGGQPGADRKGPLGGDRWNGPVSNRGPSAGDLLDHVHASRLQRGEARRDRADERLHGDCQCRAARRVRGRDGDRHRREPDRRRPERQTAAGAEQRGTDRDSGVPRLERAAHGHSRDHRGVQQRRDRRRHVDVRDSWRADDGGTPAGRRNQRRGVARRRRRVRVHRRRRQQPGSHDEHVGRARRSRNRWSLHECGAADRRQPLQWLVPRGDGPHRAPGRQLYAGPEGLRAARTGANPHQFRRRRGFRRADLPGIACGTSAISARPRTPTPFPACMRTGMPGTRPRGATIPISRGRHSRLHGGASRACGSPGS